MEIVKDFFEAIGSRIRSHFFGSIAIAFIYFNWKPLFYLFFSETTVPAKFIYFDGATTLDTLLWLPLKYGVAIALVAPWVAFVGTLWAAFPTKFIKDVQASISSATISRKYELEIKRNSKKLEVIASAKAVEEEFETLSDLEEKERIREEFSQQDDKNPAIEHAQLAMELPEVAKQLLLGADTSPHKIIDISLLPDGGLRVRAGGTDLEDVSMALIPNFYQAIDLLVGKNLIANKSPTATPNSKFIATELAKPVTRILRSMSNVPSDIIDRNKSPTPE